MAKFKLEYTRRALRDLDKFDLSTQRRIVQESLELEEDP
jgi:mRNA-degrading endonuclease RelE of RelBE toxin-antitoxin system